MDHREVLVAGAGEEAGRGHSPRAVAAHHRDRPLRELHREPVAAKGDHLDGDRTGEVAVGDLAGLADIQNHARLVVEPFRLAATDQFVAERGGAQDFTVRNICANGRIALSDGTVRDVLKERIAERNAEGKKTRIDENTLSLGMIVSYGRFRLFTAGDALGRFFEEALADAVEHCHV